MEAGADDIVVKPLRREELERMLVAAARSRRCTAQLDMARAGAVGTIVDTIQSSAKYWARRPGAPLRRGLRRAVPPTFPLGAAVRRHRPTASA
jgi:hypothetical protein